MAKKTVTKSEVREKLDSIDDTGLTGVVVITMKEGGDISLESTVTNTVEMQYLFNRASFELNVYEMGQRNNSKKAAE